MKELVWHLWESNRDEIVKRSLLNCHVPGLHSIMLLECPEKTIRLYVAVPGNTLYRNQSPFGPDQSIGFHAHHCEITIHVVRGAVRNIIAGQSDKAGVIFGKYRYQSPITSGGNGYFDFIGTDLMNIVSQKMIHEKESVFMKASEIHTVSCSTTDTTAWFVYEGRECKEYNPFTYSMADLTKHSNDGLYVRPTENEVYSLLKQIF